MLGLLLLLKANRFVLLSRLGVRRVAVMRSFERDGGHGLLWAVKDSSNHPCAHGSHVAAAGSLGGG
jgi:hypothetical protein